MVFSLKHNIKEPSNGQTRVIKRFAWLPVVIIDNEKGAKKVWLGWYEVLQGYIITRYAAWMGEEQVGFAVGKWTDLSKRLK